MHKDMYASSGEWHAQRLRPQAPLIGGEVTGSRRRWPLALADKPQVRPGIMILLVMRPHPDDLHRLDVPKDLIYEAMLDVDAAGDRSLQITPEPLKRRRSLVRVLFRMSSSFSALGRSPAAESILASFPACRV